MPASLDLAWQLPGGVVGAGSRRGGMDGGRAAEIALNLNRKCISVNSKALEAAYDGRTFACLRKGDERWIETSIPSCRSFELPVPISESTNAA